MTLSEIGNVTPQKVIEAARQYGTPLYLYDEDTILYKCRQVLEMPNAFGLVPSYAIKANANKALLQLVTSQGFELDLSSLNEGKRAHLAGIPYNKMQLTTQEIPVGQDRIDLQEAIKAGLKYTVCSLQQLELIADFAAENSIPLAYRIHPGEGSGESVTRNTGDKYSCFGIHLSDIDKALVLAHSKGVIFDQLHVHIGSGGDPEKWRENIDRELKFVENYFPDVTTVNLGGGFKEARMPDETVADLQELGRYAKEKFEDFYSRTNRKLAMQIEPGTFIMANAGYLVTSVVDRKSTGPDGFDFIILNGGMEANSRPVLYGSRHPFYVISQNGDILSTENDLSNLDEQKDLRVIVGRCCESGDSQSLDSQGNIVPRVMANPETGDYVVIGGTGAYCSGMTLVNYNSYSQAPEVLLRKDGRLQLVRRLQTIEQMIQNEFDLD